VLVMSATPIPRSLALILYGDLDLSVISEMPAGRRPVRTRLVPENKREDMYAFLRQELKRGRQAYIVCPLVEEDGETDEKLRSAKTVYDRLRQGELKDFHLALTWGGQKGTEKTQALEAFVRGETDVLVATTVIEVGVNNPNATIMIIENAERYGLSQLHQLRGRVGRGSEESWCFLLSESTEKLRVLLETGDGFVIAQKDLELRGPGDLMGVQQSGDAPGLAMEGGVLLLDEVSQCVRALYRDDAQRETLRTLEKLAKQTFEKESRAVALN
jgi:ATP-dependent DNA helicase RecG